MPVSIVRQDITKIKADAIVSASGHDFSGHGMVASAIFNAAGPGLQLECDKKRFLDTAETLVTGAYQLPAKKVIHTVGPEFKDGHSGEALLLAQCYRNCMDSAWEAGCKSIAFPLISSGGYRFPKENALSTAMEAVASSEHADEMDVTLAVYDRSSYEVSRDMLEEIRDYLGEDNGAKYLRSIPMPEEIEGAAANKLHHEKRRLNRRSASRGMDYLACSCMEEETLPKSAPKSAEKLHSPEDTSLSHKSEKEMLQDLKEAMTRHDESFSESIKRLIEERGIKPSACYHAANISKAVFSNIMNKEDYKPTKATAFAFAVALKMSVAETKELLEKAGFAMSSVFPLDRAMEYLIAHRVYDIYDVNSILFELDLPLLGEKSE